MYSLFFRLVFVRMDPELAHRLAFAVIRWLPATGLGGLVRRFTAAPPSAAVEALGLRFPGPFGLAAGFDKDAEAIRGLGQLGFGHVEVGTITARPQAGNPRPRLFRLLPDRAVINRMGFNNGGAEAAAARLRRLRATHDDLPVIGVNIGKSRVVDVENAVDDYRVSARLVAPLADYLVVNVSSPNTPGLRGLQELDRLEPLLTAVREESGKVPLLVKIAPDLADEEVRHVGELVTRLGLDGVIATNTTISRDSLSTPEATVTAAGAGGLSGRPLARRSLEVLRILRSSVPAELCVISVGGVETADDVRDRLAAGATLVQGYTGFLYRGPLWARQINRGL
jgi:dihydroorotate dehydrogenase